MSELILLRHGKSDWGAGTGDAERPLNRRGEEAARLMGRVISSAQRIPDLVLTSPARRARLTAALAAEAGGWASLIIEDARLSPGSPRQVVQVVQERSGGIDRVMVVGHEPTLSQAAAWLLGGASLHLPTAAAACLAVDDWEALAPGAATLLWLITPRLFTDRRAGSP